MILYENSWQEMVSNPHDFVSDVSYALGGKSAEFVLLFHVM
jgi:hypothetical protein